MASVFLKQVALSSLLGFGFGWTVHHFCFAPKASTDQEQSHTREVTAEVGDEQVAARSAPPSSQPKEPKTEVVALPLVGDVSEIKQKLLPSEILAADMQSCLSPGSNAINFLKDIIKENDALSEKDRARISYAINVFQASSWQGVTVPSVLASDVDTGEDETLDEDTREWLRANFTQLGGGGTGKVKSLKALGTATLFAMRLKRNVSSMVESLPFEADVKTRKAIEQHLVGAAKWDYDIWKLKELTQGRELQTMGWHVLEQHGLISHFGLERPQLRKWLAHVESLYTKTAYHSATHAADVLQGVHFFLVTCGGTKLISKIESLALLLAAIIHDTAHDGLNNNYHKNALTDRALKFNDQSIQENFHVSLVFEHTLNDPSMNIFGNFNQEQKVELRQLLIKLVLDTDMSRHFSNMQAFQSAIAERGSDPEKWATATETVLCILLHLADISNPARPLHKARKWAELVLEEFWAQGDLELKHELPVSPNCGRTTELATSQIGFISYIVMPFFKLAGDMLPEVNQLVVPHLTSNLDHWKKLQDPVKVTARRKSVVAVQPPPPGLPGASSPNQPRSPLPRAIKE
mmetsp:Transcript_59150/g.139326  ORF Transcript_59150/g.139326 Transcript_59150/m.139326 type:complete len:578 (+) Transcript_59150:153-1886(+)